MNNGGKVHAASLQILFFLCYYSHAYKFFKLAHETKLQTLECVHYFWKLYKSHTCIHTYYVGTYVLIHNIHEQIELYMNHGVLMTVSFFSKEFITKSFGLNANKV